MADFTVARPGQVNSSGSATALFLKVFGGEVLASFDTHNIMSGLHRTRTISSGKSAQFPKHGLTTAGYHTPGAEILGNAIKANEVVITIDDLLVSSVSIANIDEAMAHYDIRSVYSDRVGKALAKAYDKRCLQMVINAARTTTPTITSDNAGESLAVDAYATDAATLLAGIISANQKLDEKNIDSDQRHVVLRPAQWWLLFANKQILNTDYNGSGSYASGTMPMVAGTTIHKSNNIPSTNISAVTGENNTYAANFTKTVGAVFHPDCIATVSLLDLAVESEYSVSRQSTLVVAKYAKGTGPLTPECAIELATLS